MSEWAYALGSAAVISLISLVGVVTIIIGVKRIDRIIPLLISLAVGALFADALVHLLPEAFEESTSPALTSLYVIVGILLFFVMERFLHWHHEHRARSVNPVHPVAYINLVSDGIHNFLDGLIIGAAYLVSIPVGLATSVAVALHEVPQEQGDFGILVNAGFTPRRALQMNFLSAGLALVGVVISLSVGSGLGDYTVFMLPFTAGGFIYIAGSDLIPELHAERELPGSLAQFASMVAAIALMFLLLLID